MAKSAEQRGDAFDESAQPRIAAAVMEPSSESASANTIEMPAPMAAASPIKNRPAAMMVRGGGWDPPSATRRTRVLGVARPRGVHEGT